MFRLQDNIPSTYVNQSRDFQLLCRLYDCINNGVMFDINTITNLFDPNLVNDKMLLLLCTKIGFYPKHDIDSTTLRYIISAFPYLLKYKGSKQGIEGAACVLAKAANTNSDFYVEIINSDNITGENIYNIDIYFSGNINEKALNDVLRYIMPIGYTYTIYDSFEMRSGTSNLTTFETNSYYINNIIDASSIPGSGTDLTSLNSNSLHTYYRSEIIGSDNQSEGE